MKITLSTLLFCLLVAANAAAQPGPLRGDGDWGPPSPQDRVERLSEDLDLNEEQTAKLLDIFTASDAEREALRKKHEELIRQDVCSFHEKMNGQIKSVLTAEQSTKFDDLMARKKAHREGHHRHHHGKDRWSAMGCADEDVPPKAAQ